MRRRSLVAIGLAAYAIGIIVGAPASLFDSGLQRWSDGRLRLAAARGTLWAGSGQIEIRDLTGHRGLAEPVDWRLAPLSLLRGRLDYQVRLARAARPFLLSLSAAGASLGQAEFTLPAGVFGLALPRLGPLGLSGDVVVQLAGLSFKSRQAQGKASLQWRDAGSALTPIAPLGAYQLSLDAGHSGVRAVLQTLAGPLQLNGQASWVAGGASDFQAVAFVPPQYREQLVPLLRLIAVERGAGNFDLAP